MQDLRRILNAAVTHRDHPWCLATLVRTQGSSYRQPGARLLVHPDGRSTIGFLSAGCLEDEIARQGGEVIWMGVPRLISFDTRRLFGCDGSLTVYLEKIPAAGQGDNFLTQLAGRVARRQACQIIVPYADSGASAILTDQGCREDFLRSSPPQAPGSESGIFLQSLPPPRRLLVIGDGPEVTPMRTFAEALGWNFHGYSHPDAIPEDFTGDAATAAVVMTHKVGRDLAALQRLVPLGLPYIGLLGAKRRHQELLSQWADLYHTGLPPLWLENLHAPAGLDTGSESPEEIAFSILAEASAVLSGRTGGFLREKTGPIHSPVDRLEVGV